jgi:hypothetical protein
VKSDGSIAKEKIPALVVKGKIQIHDTSIPIEVADHLLRVLPNGLVEDYVVDDPVFQSGLGQSLYTVHVHRSQLPAAQQRAAIQNITNNFHGANSRVNIASTDNSTNVSGGMDLEKMQAFLSQLKPVIGGLPEPQQTEIKSQLSLLDDEIRSGTPSRSKISAALQSIKTIAEGAAGNLIAAGIVGMLASMRA